MSTNPWATAPPEPGDDPFAVEQFDSVPSLSFPTEGTIQEGTVVSIEPDVQGHVYSKDPTAPKVKAEWPSGDPKLSIVITLRTTEGDRAFWVTKWPKNARFQAIKQAQQELGRPMQKGDTLKVAYTGNDPANTDRKLYKAKIEPGQVGGNSDPFATPAKQEDEVPF